MSFNYVDLAIVLILILFISLGIRRGFLAGLADIAAMLVAFLIAIKGYAPVTNWLGDVLDLPRILLNFVALMGLFILGEWLFGLIVVPLLGFAYRHILIGPLRLLDTVAGIVPGLTKGLLLAAALVTFFALFPVNDDLRAEVQSSQLGNRLAAEVGNAAPRLESLFGGSLHDTALFITQPPEGESSRKMNFPQNMALHEESVDEDRMLLLLNAERRQAGLAPLILDVRLRAVARAHSTDMFRRSYFAHESPVGDTPADRLRRAEVPFLAMGENLAYAPSVDIAHTGLMNSPGHRRNILSPQFGHVGIGVIDGGIYGKMFSQEFTN